MDITIGIQNVARELSAEVAEDVAAITERVADALAAGGPLSITDVKGQTIVVPAGAIGYVIVGSPEGRRVGFGL